MKTARLKLKLTNLFVVFSLLLMAGCSEVDIKNKDAVTSYLRNHFFDNGKGSALGFDNNGNCAFVTTDGNISCAYNVELNDDTYANINVPGCFTQFPFKWKINNEGEIFCSGYVDGTYKVFSVYEPKSK